MAQATYSIADFNQASYFKSWTVSLPTPTHGYTTPSENTQAKTVTISGLPTGATINWAKIYYTAALGLYGGTHTPASGDAVSATPGGTVTINFYWKSNTGGSYPAASYPGATTYLDKTGLIQLTGVYVLVDYTESGAPPPGTSALYLSTTHIVAGDTMYANIGKADATYRHTIIYAIGGNNLAVSSLGSGENPAPFTIPLDWLAEAPNTPHFNVTVYLYTLNAAGTVQIGETSTNIVVYAPASVVPTLTGLTATLVSNGVDTSITHYVKNYSKCALEITGAAGAYNSTISSYKITGGGFTVNAVSGTVGTFGTSGDLTFTATITDSRGRTAIATVTITVDAYTLPSLAVISAFRCDVNGTADRAGAYVLLKATPIISPIGGQNSAALAGRVYAKGGTPGTPETMVSNTASILGGGLLLPVKTYIAEIIVQDLINSAIYTKTIPTDRVALHFLDSISAGAINKYAEIENAFEIAWPMLMLDGGPAAKHEIGDILITLNSTSPATRYPGTTWAAIAAGTFLVAAGTGYTAGSTGGEATHTLTQAELPDVYRFPSGTYYYGASLGYPLSQVGLAPLVGTIYNSAVNAGGKLGDGVAHNNLPPYLAVYMWERTA